MCNLSTRSPRQSVRRPRAHHHTAPPPRAVAAATPATGFKMRQLSVYDPVLNGGTLLADPVALHPAEGLTLAAFEASSKVPVIS